MKSGAAKRDPAGAQTRQRKAQKDKERQKTKEDNYLGYRRLAAKQGAAVEGEMYRPWHLFFASKASEPVAPLALAAQLGGGRFNGLRVVTFFLLLM